MGKKCPTMAVSLLPFEAPVFQPSIDQTALGFHSWLWILWLQRTVLVLLVLGSSRAGPLEQGSLSDHFICVSMLTQTHTHTQYTHMCTCGCTYTTHVYNFPQAKVSVEPQSVEQVNGGIGR